MISHELRRQADFFLDVAELAKTVGRIPPVDRTSQAERQHGTERAVDRPMATVDPKGT